jgi:hypothetical protein
MFRRLFAYLSLIILRSDLLDCYLRGCRLRRGRLVRSRRVGLARALVLVKILWITGACPGVPEHEELEPAGIYPDYIDYCDYEADHDGGRGESQQPARGLALP